jgi:hypothetical protein
LSTIAGMLALSYCVHRNVEVPVARRMKQFFAMTRTVRPA